MTKDLTVTLSDIEYQILQRLKIVEGVDGEKLRNILRIYIATVPELKSSEYALRRLEHKDAIWGILEDVWAQHELTDYPMEYWKEDKTNTLINDLVEINVLVETREKQYIPSNKFRSLFKMLLHDITTESRDMDEYSAACIATIQLLMEFGAGCLDRETMRDATIFINEGWMFVYATPIKKAREFMKTKRKFPEAEMPVPEV